VALFLAVGLIIGLFGGYLLYPVLVHPTSVEFTGNVSIPDAVSLRFNHTASNLTVDTVLPVNNAQVKGYLVGGVSYVITAYSVNKSSICTSALYVPIDFGTFTASIVCG